MQNLRRVGKNAGPILSCLWTKVHILRRCRRPLVVFSALARLGLCISSFIRKIWAVKFAVKLRSRRKKVGFGPPICRERGYPRFWTYIFKSHSLPSMWSVFVDFRSLSSEAIWRIKKKNIEEDRIAVKPKSADFVGRPNKNQISKSVT